ncbi:MAG: helix-turn-helix domain-containing protein [Spirochaetaceae bacterium]|jgi:transcriptional regulator with XRE-family HTH domain|nr:helix-turn-helix domain-containing protein [Spirochaetaceae bacterium]
MTSLGDTLRKAREDRGLTIDDVARDTNIARRYLVALEEENFAQFPAEAYAQGFMKNYGEYLGIDTEEIFSMYRVLKMQETPIPMDKITEKPRVAPKVLPVVIILFILLGGGGAYFFLSRSKPETKAEPVAHVVQNHIFESGVLEQRFYAGDSLTVPANGEFYKFTLASFGEVVTIDTPSGVLILDLSQTVSVDLDNDGINELAISLEDYSRTDPLMGAWIRFELQGNGVGEAVSGTENTATNATAVADNARTVFSSTAPYPFTLQAEFQGFCMFRWQVLREANRSSRTEQYFARGTDLSIQAVQNGVRLWVSNAAAVKLQAIGSGRTQAVEIGGPGEVVVVDIAWVREETGGWKLAVVRLEN